MHSAFEYDYNEDQISQNITVHKIPMSMECPLGMSRFNEEAMSSHRRVLMDLQKFIQDSKNKENQKIQQYKERQKNIGQTISQQQKQKQSKLNQLKEQQKKKMTKQCPFKPSLHTDNGPRRKFNEFIQHQYAHSQKVMEKRKQMKKNLQQRKQKATYRPKINNRSRRQSKETSTVFDRLYNLRQKEKEQFYEDSTNKLFHPTINERSKNLHRDGAVEDLLYSDAQRRQDKERQNLFTSTSQNSKFQKPVNSNNNKYAAQKFIKQFFFILEDLKIETSNQSTIDYVMFNELLKEMGFVTNEQEQQTKASSNERALVHDAYEILQKYQVNAHNVCVFLLGLLGIYNIYPVDFQDGDQPLEDKEFNLDEQSGRKLQRHFDLFYRNRLSSDVGRKNQQKTQSYTFQPTINKQSNELACRHRNLMLEEANVLLEQYPELQFVIPEDGVISHTDLLVLHKMAKDLQNQMKKEELNEKQLQQCTFKPNTISMTASKLQQNNLGYKKSFELYNFHKNIQSKKQSLQASRANEEDKQCTFIPQINRYKPLKHPLAPISKQTQETLYRMHKGRQEHEEKRNFLQRGQKAIRSRNPSQKTQPQRIAHLILDVNLGDKVDRLILYRGDEHRLDEVAHEFALKHNLQQENEQTLLEMLEVQLENLLSKIEEDEESQDGQY